MVLMAFEDLLVQMEQKESLVRQGHLDHYLTLWISPLWGKDYKILLKTSVDFIDFYTKNFYSTQRTLHAETFIHRNLYTQRNVYARELLRKDASTHTE